MRVIPPFTRRGDKINDNQTTIILKKRKKGFHLFFSKDKNIDLVTTRKQASLQLEMICKIWQVRNVILFIPFN